MKSALKFPNFSLFVFCISIHIQKTNYELKKPADIHFLVHLISNVYIMIQVQSHNNNGLFRTKKYSISRVSFIKTIKVSSFS